MALIVALAIGIAFGFTLERAGLGTAPKLAAQFYLADFTVMKVMFTAIAVAMTGAFWLGRLGVLDLTSVFVPDTVLVPQVIGGAIFGAGFLVAGLCPGTSCVAAATGRRDGLAVMGGMFAGILIAGLALTPFINGTSRGAWTLPQLLHVPYGVVVAVVIAAATVGAGFSRSRYRFALLIVLASITAFAGSPYITRYVEARDLAAWIKDGRPGLEIIDTRPAQEFAMVRIPKSENRPGDGAIIVKAEGREFVLRGGIQAWTSDVVKTQHPTVTTKYFAPLRRQGC